MFMRKLTRQVVCTYDDPVAKTPKGDIRGLKIDDTYIFRGIKYADAKRFHLPEPVKPWEGTKEAIVYGHVCPELNTPVPHDAYTVPHYFYPQNEDCQYVNVWTKNLDTQAKKPVMVWMHGGGWFSGSSVEIYSYDGENLASYGDVVVVSLNHRLNILGYLDLSAYGEQYKYSANAGLADLVAALAWVKENIAAFGGDPDNVTIFGQSGGGAKVLSMLQTPAADGLFHKAIMQSGGAEGKSAPTTAEDKQTAQQFAALVVEKLGLDAATISQIETVDWYDLAEAAGEAIYQMRTEFGKSVSFGPLYDGDYYYGHPGKYGFREQAKHIPMIVGSCLGEFSGNFDKPYGEGSKNAWSDDYTRELVKQRYGDKADRIIAAYQKAYPGRNLADVFFLDTKFRSGALGFTKLRAGFTDAPCYNYMFALEGPFKGGTVAWHNAEEPYVFRNAAYTEASYTPGVSEKLESIMSDAWLNFARTGNPNHEGMPEWPPVQADSVPTMLFDRECGVLTDNDAELIELLTEPESGFALSKKMVAFYGIETKK